MKNLLSAAAYQGCNQKFIGGGGVFSRLFWFLSFPSPPFFTFPPLFLPPRSSRQIQVKDLESAVSSPVGGE